jgi:NAD-dependent dihydropyrimidine dehydrogenase PreA subunit
MMLALSTINTLKFDLELCTGCGICVDVCPHGVFALNNHTIHPVRVDACMECGACQVNCPFGAIKVDSGVGCAAAMIQSALLRKKQVECG